MNLNTYELEIDVDGEAVPVTFEEPNPLKQMELILGAPVSENGPEDIETMSEARALTDWIESIVEEASDFPVELLDELPPDAFGILVNATVLVVVHEDPTPAVKEHNDQPSLADMDLDLDISPDGTIDPEDWR